MIKLNKRVEVKVRRGVVDWYITNDFVQQPHAVHGLLLGVELVEVGDAREHHAHLVSPLGVQLLPTNWVNK